MKEMRKQWWKFAANNMQNIILQFEGNFGKLIAASIEQKLNIIV